MPSGNGQPRDYNIATDTANGVVNSDTLADQIAVDAGITTALDHINTDPDAELLSIFFVAALDAPQIAALDAVVAAHQGTPTSFKFQLFESNPAQSTALQAYQTAFTRNTEPLSAGTYRLTWYCEMRVVAAGQLDAHAQCEFRAAANTLGNDAVYDEEWQACTGWDRFVATDGQVLTVDIRYRRQGGGNDTVEIRKLKMGVESIDT